MSLFKNATGPYRDPMAFPEMDPAEVLAGGPAPLGRRPTPEEQARGVVGPSRDPMVPAQHGLVSDVFGTWRVKGDA